VILHVVAVCFPVIFLAELPDKTMFASLLMATRGRPGQVWLGAAGAFVVHVAIATTVGVALLEVLPRRGVDGFVAALFAVGALYAWREGTRTEAGAVERERGRHGAVLSAFVVIFVAEWGDLTQILTANLAAKFNSPLSVATGATLALWSVAAIAVLSGQRLLRLVDAATVRRVTAVVLTGLAGWSLWEALQ